jgi:magnesium-transporting ATPase (P-type)
MRLRLLLLSLAVNHTVLVETSRDPETGDEIGTSLSASSPDEEAFVQAASFFGLRFSARTQDHVSLQPSPALRLGAPGEARFRLVALLPYTSARKMMSLIVEDLQVAERVRLGTGGDVGELLQPHHFLLLTKGADVRVLPRCALPASSDPAMQRAMEAADEWSSDGLRTLMWAWRPLDEGQLVDWVPRYTAALGQQRGQADGGGDGAVSALQDEMESSLRLLGCTANEDLLQEGVPEEIAALSSAGIRIYVLTGDKVGTAMNIASSCNLIRPGYE